MKKEWLEVSTRSNEDLKAMATSSSKTGENVFDVALSFLKLDCTLDEAVNYFSNLTKESNNIYASIVFQDLNEVIGYEYDDYETNQLYYDKQSCYDYILSMKYLHNTSWLSKRVTKVQFENNNRFYHALYNEIKSDLLHNYPDLNECYLKLAYEEAFYYPSLGLCTMLY